MLNTMLPEIEPITFDAEGRIQETPASIARHYAAAMDSVSLIQSLKAKDTLTSFEEDTLDRNKRHLKIMLAKDFWTTEDLNPLKAASA